MFDWILGEFKVGVYIPSLNKTFISNSINRTYEGYYGRKTDKYYTVNLSKDGKSTLINTIAFDDNFNESPTGEKIDNDKTLHSAIDEDVTFSLTDDLNSNFFASLFITLILELIVALIFAFMKKLPKLILLAVLIGNVITVPLLWALVSHYYWMLIPAEIFVVIFEALLLKLFGKGKILWRWCFIISFIMNFISFAFVPTLTTYF